MQLWLVHTWHRCDIQKWKDARQCNMYLEKERVGYKQKVLWHKALVDCNRNMNYVDKFDHVKLIHVVNWKCSILCHKIFRYFVMLVSWLHSSSTLTWLNPRQSWKISAGKALEPRWLISYVSKTEITKWVKIIRLINTSKEDTICIWTCVVREFDIQPEYMPEVCQMQHKRSQVHFHWMHTICKVPQKNTTYFCE